MTTVGSSDVAAILGLSPWRQPVEVWAQLTGLLPRYSEEDTAGQRRGRILEPALIAHYERTRGVRLEPGPPISAEPIVGADGWRSCRPDATGPGLVVEAKSTRRWDGWGADGTDKVPVHYAAQVAWQLSVMDADRVFRVMPRSLECRWDGPPWHDKAVYPTAWCRRWAAKPAPKESQ